MATPEKLIKDFLTQSADIMAPSGHEARLLTSWHSALQPFVDAAEDFPLGCKVAYKKSQGNGSVCLMAHADEVGLMVTDIDDNGFVRVDSIGGVDPLVCVGQRVVIDGRKGPVEGAIGRKPFHLQDRRQPSSAPAFEDLWVDMGLSDKDEGAAVVAIGDCGVIKSGVTATDTRLYGRALDDRSGLAVILGTAAKLHGLQLPHTVMYAGSTQEEIGARGAKALAHRLRPDMTIVIDVTHATDYPTVGPGINGNIALGKGPAIGIGPNLDQDMTHKLIEVAEKLNIPYQRKAEPTPTGTDANSVQIAADGLRVALVSIPCRYMHTPVEMVDMRDMASAVDLIAGFISSSS